MGTEFVTEMYDSEAVANNVHLGYGGCHHARTLVADLDNLPRLDESDEEAYARNERVMLAAAAEVERLKPIVGRAVGEPVPVDDREQMRAAIEEMRPIVDSMLALRDSAWLPIESARLLDARRNRVTAALAAYDARLPIYPIGDLLTPDEWGALNALGVCLEENHVYQLIDATSATGQRNRALVRSAISKLVAANAGRVR